MQTMNGRLSARQSLLNECSVCLSLSLSLSQQILQKVSTSSSLGKLSYTLTCTSAILLPHSMILKDKAGVV